MQRGTKVMLGIAAAIVVAATIFGFSQRRRPLPPSLYLPEPPLAASTGCTDNRNQPIPCPPEDTRAKSAARVWLKNSDADIIAVFETMRRAQGPSFTVPAGTPALMLSYPDGRTIEVEIAGGEKIGRRGYIDFTWITSSDPKGAK